MPLFTVSSNEYKSVVAKLLSYCANDKILDDPQFKQNKEHSIIGKMLKHASQKQSIIPAPNRHAAAQQQQQQQQKIQRSEMIHTSGMPAPRHRIAPTANRIITKQKPKAKKVDSASSSSSSPNNTSDSDSVMEADKRAARKTATTLQLPVAPSTILRDTKSIIAAAKQPRTVTTSKPTGELTIVTRPRTALRSNKSTPNSNREIMVVQQRQVVHGMQNAIGATVAVTQMTTSGNVSADLQQLVSRLIKHHTVAEPVRTQDAATTNANHGISGFGEHVVVSDNLMRETMSLDLDQHIAPLVKLLMSSEHQIAYKGSTIADIFEVKKMQELRAIDGTTKRQEFLMNPRLFSTMRLFLTEDVQTESVQRALQKSYALIDTEKLTRAWNSGQLRAAIGDERKCVMGNDCWCNVHYGFIMKEFDTKKQDEYIRKNTRETNVKMCLTCIRDLIQKHVSSGIMNNLPSTSISLCQPFCNIANIDGEYMIEDCMNITEDNLYPIVYNKVKNGYRIDRSNGVLYLKEDGYLMYKESDRIREMQVIRTAEKIEQMQSFQRGAPRKTQ